MPSKLSLEKRELRFLIDEFSRVYRKKLTLEKNLAEVNKEYEQLQSKLLDS